jgi:hypothetical protein
LFQQNRNRDAAVIVFGIPEAKTSDRAPSAVSVLRPRLERPKKGSTLTIY